MRRFRFALTASTLSILLISICAAQQAKDAPAEATYRGKSLSEWLTVLGSTDAVERGRAMIALRALGGDSDALAEKLLAGSVNLKSPSVANAVALGELGPGAVPALSRALWSQDKLLRNCIYALTGWRGWPQPSRLFDCLRPDGESGAQR